MIMIKMNSDFKIQCTSGAERDCIGINAGSCFKYTN